MALRLYSAARHSASKSQAEALQQLRSLLLLCSEIREQVRDLKEYNLLLTLSKWRPREDDHERRALKSLALRIRSLREEVAAHEARMRELVQRLCPELLECQGVGSVAASTLLLAAGDHKGRMKGPDSFAALCGTTPVPASSGKTTRYRLNRGGDRQANCVLHRAVLTRLQYDQATRDYVERCVARGKTRREAIRLLKTYVARDLYRVIKQNSQVLTS